MVMLPLDSSCKAESMFEVHWFEVLHPEANMTDNHPMLRNLVIRPSTYSWLQGNNFVENTLSSSVYPPLPRKPLSIGLAALPMFVYISAGRLRIVDVSLLEIDESATACLRTSTTAIFISVTKPARRE
eukprot:gnl/TRDRNA2_/TRDRNA2_169081_c0_seq1.p1 gnl/TRDRNA2_/TRDRNA2_169081_c0~~gnl/TRDRNA2_/TRDRNA2_169081_c0_seq1.p1  ORF type:complete len:128 (+),score=3.75 gnl/TRDRNA2_/TRDRNA2_169081_c0_seq1:50-433(+)